MRLKTCNIIDELEEIKFLSAFIHEGLAANLELETKTDSFITDKGIAGSSIVAYLITDKLNNIIANFEEEQSK